MQSDEQYLEEVCKTNLPITKAPSMLDLQLISEDGEISEDALIKQESEKLYSSLDSKRNIWLIKNPIVWEYETKFDTKVKYTATSRFRPKPIPFGDHKHSESDDKKRRF